ncbi:57e1e1d9-6f0f-4b10-a119-c831c10e5764 [Sclerotinia trifoliorum]|uniref:57e1e1d9-6f0f-4b10-a119-c831c10e5764 n=1 Tax=Sclerotinia trifoliorum TaxID=28548 RepID=A0A8H2VQ80_9HELO|nr:57e1e1d9-6f0f-4b10-a119-c831c10e5764 [Sclerotinia trifoliorum]
MKIPSGLLGFDGKPVKGEICLKGGRENGKLHEEGMKREGNHFSCYALTAEGDAITPCFSINSGVVEFVDVVVDGILRASHSNEKATQAFSKKFEWVAGQVKIRNRYVGKTYQLQIKERNIEKTRNVKGGAPHSVGSIEIQIFRQDTNSHKAPAKDSDSDDTSSSSSEEPADLGHADRAPTFEDHTEWWNLNPCVDEDAILPSPFEVGGVGHKKLQDPLRDCVVKKWPGDFKLWASFRFLLFSTTDFHKLGFLNIPDYEGTSWSDMRLNLKKSPLKDVPLTTKATSVVDAGTDDNDGDAGNLVLESEDDTDEPVETIKGKEVHKKIVKSGASRGTEVSASLAKVGGSERQNMIIKDSYSSEIHDERPDAEVIETVSKPVLPLDASQLAVPNNDEASKPADAALLVPNIKVESVELTGDSVVQVNQARTNRKKKPLSMPGVEGAPARKAWKDPAHSEWYRRNVSGSGSGDLSTINTDLLHSKQELNLSDRAQFSSSDDPEHVRQSSAPCVIGDAHKKDNAARFKSVGVEASGPSWEPMTPPASSKKGGTKHFHDFGDERRLLSGNFNGPSQIESAVRAIITKDNYSDNSSCETSLEASPSIKFRQRVAERKAEKAKQRSLGLSFEQTPPNFEEPVPSLEADMMESNFDDFIHDSPQPEDTRMIDAVEDELEPKLSPERSPSPEADPRSTNTKQEQDSVDKALPSKSQDLTASQDNEYGSQTPTEEASQSVLEEVAKMQRIEKAKRYPSSAIPEENAEKSSESLQLGIPPNIEMIGSNSNDLLAKVAKSNSKPNDAPVNIGNQQDGRQDSPAKVDESTVMVTSIEPAKQPKARVPAAFKSSSAPKTQSTPAQKTPAVKVERSSKVPAQSEQSQAKPKKPAPKVSKVPNAVGGPKTAKAATPAIAEETTSNHKGKASSKAETNDKRKADQMTSAGSTSGPNKTNSSPALKQTSIVERETAAAEARMQAAAEKKRALEEQLEAAHNMKVQMEKANEINRQAQALEEENAALEAEIAKISAQYVA